MNSKIIELAANLAHNRTLYESGDICSNEDDMFISDGKDGLRYKEIIQERFNLFYGMYLDEVNKIFLSELIPPPGDTIKELMDFYNISLIELSKVLQLSYGDTCKLLRGRLPLSSDVADKLETLFTVPTSFWKKRDETYQKQ